MTPASGRAILSSAPDQTHWAATVPSLQLSGLFSFKNETFSEHSHEELVIFRHDAGPAVYLAVTSFYLYSSITPIKSKINILAGVYVRTSPVMALFCEKQCRGDRRRKSQSDTFRKCFRAAITQLARAFRPVAD